MNSGQKPGERAAQGTPAEVQTGKTSPEPRPGVKALEWKEVTAARSDEDPTLEHTGDYEAGTPFGTYYIEQYFGTDSYGWEVTVNGYDKVADKDDPSDAKAAAQADYERRILSALSEPEQQEVVAWQFRVGDDYDKHNADHNTYGIDVFETEKLPSIDPWWGNRIEVYGSEKLRDFVLSKLNTPQPNKTAALEAEIERLTELLCLADEAFMSRHGCFPLDRVMDNQRFWNDAMKAVRAVTGEDYHARKASAARALNLTEKK